MQPTEVSVNVTDGRSFSPNVVTVSPGDRVVWTNLDSVAHGVKSGAGPNSSGTYSAGIAPGQKYTWRVPGTLRQGTDLAYTCPFDQHMQGIIHIK
jgi:plastocyanin